MGCTTNEWKKYCKKGSCIFDGSGNGSVAFRL